MLDGTQQGSNRPRISFPPSGGGSGAGSGATIDGGVRVDADEFFVDGGLRLVGVAYIDLDTRV